MSPVGVPTELLRRVNILRFVSIDVDQDDLSGAVRQTGVQTGHCKRVNDASVTCFVFYEDKHDLSPMHAQR